MSILMMGACDPGSNERIGVGLIEPDTPYLQLALCPADEVVAVTLYALKGNVIGDYDEVLWRATGSTESAELEIGSPSEGLTEEVSLTAPGWRDEPLGAEVRTSVGGSLGASFSIDDLVAGKIFHEGQL